MTDKEKYSVNQRIRGGSFVDRLNPKIVSSHIEAHIGAKHLPFPLVEETSHHHPVQEQDKNRRNRIGILHDRFKK
jgi:hypothetical protein